MVHAFQLAFKRQTTGLTQIKPRSARNRVLWPQTLIHLFKLKYMKFIISLLFYVLYVNNSKDSSQPNNARKVKNLAT